MAKKALGRGLNAIFEEVEESYNKEFQHSLNKNDIINEIDIDLIKPNPYQPRVHFDEQALNELAQSIINHGLLQPIIVYKENGEYILLAGERRLRASKIAKLNSIKCIVADIDSKNLRELALIENIQRENLNAIELALCYKELINEHKITQDELAKLIHKSRVQITNTLRLLSLDEKTQELICNLKLSQGHAKVLVGLNKEEESTVVDTILGQKLSVRETENLVKKIKNIDQAPKKKTLHVNNIDKVKEIFKNDNLNIKLSQNSITIKFLNDEEVEKFIKKYNTI